MKYKIQYLPFYIECKEDEDISLKVKQRHFNLVSLKEHEDWEILEEKK
jgi:hypothetical protein